MDKATPAELLHELRIDAKKLRYLIDVTRRFYDTNDIDCVLSTLKKLQRALGDFNDARVQEKRLLEYGQAMGAAGGSVNAVLALGQLAERSRQRAQQLRPYVMSSLAQFRTGRTRSACRRAFKRVSQAEHTR